MPRAKKSAYKRKKRTYAKKRTYRKRRNYKGKQYRSLTGFPQSNRALLRWCKENEFEMNVGANEVYNVRCNSIYDPEGNVAPGNSVMNYNLWAQLYNHYMVRSATITVTFFVPAQVAPSADTLILFLRLNDDNAISGLFTFSNICAGPLTKYKMILPGSVPQIVKLTGTYNAKRFFQLKDVEDNQERVGAPFGNDPTEEAYWNVGAFTLSGLTTTYSVNALVDVKYNTYFTEPRDQNILV